MGAEATRRFVRIPLGKTMEITNNGSQGMKGGSSLRHLHSTRSAQLRNLTLLTKMRVEQRRSEQRICEATVVICRGWEVNSHESGKLTSNKSAGAPFALEA